MIITLKLITCIVVFCLYLFEIPNNRLQYNFLKLLNFEENEVKLYF